MRHSGFAIIAIVLFIAAPQMVHAQAPAPRTLITVSDALAELSQRVLPAVVHISATGYAAGGGSGQELLTRRRSSGSGVLVDPQGYIITNAHVVGGARRVQVRLYDEEGNAHNRRSILSRPMRELGAQIIGLDSETDIAVLKIPGTDLPYLEFGDSDELNPGRLVLAFGSPMGLVNSVTMGVVSSTARQLQPEDPMIYIQTDASINQGNSGGPLVDGRGRVVGINTFILSQSGGSEGLGFAAPSNIVKNVYRQIREFGEVRRGAIGVRAQTITPLLAAGLGLSQTWGVILGDVYPGSPAALAGLRVGDVVLYLNGKAMENGRQFDVNLYGYADGEQVALEILRGTEQKTVRVRVVERVEEIDQLSGLVTPERNLIPELGILALELSAQVAQLLPPLRRSSGVVVAARAANAGYWVETLLPGDVIYTLNGRSVTGLADLRAAAGAVKIYEPIVLQVVRNGELLFVAQERQ